MHDVHPKRCRVPSLVKVGPCPKATNNHPFSLTVMALRCDEYLDESVNCKVSNSGVVMRIKRISRENGKTEVISIEQAVEKLRGYYSLPIDDIRAILVSGSQLPTISFIYERAV